MKAFSVILSIVAFQILRAALNDIENTEDDTVNEQRENVRLETLMEIRQILSEVPDVPDAGNSAFAENNTKASLPNNSDEYSDLAQVEDDDLEENSNETTTVPYKNNGVSSRESSSCQESETYWIKFWIFWVTVYLFLELLLLRSLYFYQ
jgi:hypothetical protein